MPVGTCNTGSASDQGTNTQSPLLWWEVAEQHAASDLPFLDFFAEHVGAGNDCSEEEMMRLIVDRYADRVVQPVGGWADFRQQRWGSDGPLIEEWFDAGEELQHSELELPIEEPDGWDVALQWMRSLAAATGLRPA